MTDDEDDDNEHTAPILQVVDFNALSAALGDGPPSPPPPPSSSKGESQGRKNATYSSRPRPLPQVRLPAELDVPAVIIKTDDTVPTGPPVQMTVPMLGAPPIGSKGGSVAGAPATSALGADDLAVTTPRTAPRKRPPRPRQHTMIVRPRGPSTLQKIVVFFALLIVFVAGGIAFLVYGGAFGPDPEPPPQAPAAPR